MSEADPIDNRRGQSALAYRITDQEGSRLRMLARLHSYPIASGPNQGRQPLAQLTTRDATDPAVALLSACAAVFDVLSFYQERIANEGYLRTATQDFSLRQLAQTIGYQPAPALAASTYLSFGTDQTSMMPDSIVVPSGTRVKSVPGQGEQVQTFETTADFTARPSFNQLRAQKTCAQTVGSADPSGTPITTLLLSGVTSGLRVGDLLRVASATTLQVQQVVPNLPQRCTQVTVSVLDGPALCLSPPPVLPAGDPGALPAVLNADTVKQYILGCTWDDASLAACLRDRGWSAVALGQQVQQALATASVPQVVLAYRQTLACFGVGAAPYASLPKPDPTYYRGSDLYAAATSSWDDSDGNNLRTVWLDSWGRLNRAQSSACDIYLERSVSGILPGSSLLLFCPRGVSEKTVTAVVQTTVRGYGTVARTTGLQLSPGPATADAAASEVFLTRDTRAYLQSEPLPLCAVVPLPCPPPVSDRVTLDSMVLGLVPGQPLILTGEPVAAPGTTQSEVVFLSHAEHSGGYTTLYFRTPLSCGYRQKTVTLSANVVAASHGETVASEILGSGDGGQQNQRFALKRTPLTYLPAVGETGSASTLEVRVNGVLWREVTSLLGEDASSPCYIIQRDENERASVLFGDGVHGARLPSGQNNLVASYRFGSGPGGQVRSGSLLLLLTRPLGLRSVVNPLAAVGGTAAETTAELRDNAPLSARTLGRAVSLSDYEALAGAFPDIAKAQAAAVPLGSGTAIHLTVATADGTPLLSSSALYQSLQRALLTLGNPTQSLVLSDYQPRKFRLHALLTVDGSFASTDVLANVAAALRQAFSFARRDFTQPVRAAEVIFVMAQVAGVVGVVLSALYPSAAAVANNPMLDAAPSTLDQLGQSSGAELLLLELLDADLEISP